MLRFLLAVAIASIAESATVTYNLTVGNVDAAPDGFTRPIVAAGLTPATLQFPGPLLTATKGDVLKIKVTNKLNDPNMRRSTSINWSGILQHGNPQDDGQSMVTQCPIAPNSSYTYTINTGNQSGTFLYRSGLSVQYDDGLRGPLIIYDPDDPNKHLYDIDDASTIIQLGEWYETFSPLIIQQFQAAASIPIYDAGLINGVGRTNANPDVPYVVFNVVKGKRYRWRVISNAPRATFPIIVDQHNVTVIEADGNAIEPVNVEAVNVYPGQRYSVVFEANQPIGNYWFRSPPAGGNQSHNPNLNATFNKAIVRYVGAPIEDPTTEAANVTVLTESQIHPLINPGPIGGANATPDLSLVMNFTTMSSNNVTLDTWAINSIIYQFPTDPTLHSILHNNDSFPTSSHVVQVKPGGLVELIMPLGEDGGGHPIHMHGVQFSVIQPGDTNVTNLVNPSRRDVVPVIGDTTIIRFKLPDVGVFHLNCHIIWHAEVGLQMTFITPPDGIRAAVHPAKEWEDLCTTYFALPPELQ